jgi:hypothetical protein
MVGTYHGDERLQGQDLVVEAVWDLVAEQPDKGGVDMAGRDRRDGGQAAFVWHHDLNRRVTLSEVLEEAEQVDRAGAEGDRADAQLAGHDAAQRGHRGKSWKAFLFGSVDSSNFITVDKTPASLWVMELSGRIFGFSS